MYGHLNMKRDFVVSNCRYDDMDYASAVQAATTPTKRKFTKQEVLAAIKQLGLK